METATSLLLPAACGQHNGKWKWLYWYPNIASAPSVIFLWQTWLVTIAGGCGMTGKRSTLLWLSVEHSSRMPEFVRTCKMKYPPNQNISALTHWMCTKQQLACLRCCLPRCSRSLASLCAAKCPINILKYSQNRPWSSFTIYEDEEVRLFSNSTVEERF